MDEHTHPDRRQDPSLLSDEGCELQRTHLSRVDKGQTKAHKKLSAGPCTHPRARPPLATLFFIII